MRRRQEPLDTRRRAIFYLQAGQWHISIAVVLSTKDEQRKCHAKPPRRATRNDQLRGGQNKQGRGRSPPQPWLLYERCSPGVHTFYGRAQTTSDAVAAAVLLVAAASPETECKYQNRALRALLTVGWGMRSPRLIRSPVVNVHHHGPRRKPAAQVYPPAFPVCQISAAGLARRRTCACACEGRVPVRSEIGFGATKVQRTD